MGSVPSQPTPTPHVQRALLRAGLALLSAAGAVGIVVLLTGSDVGDTEASVLLTTVIFGAQALVFVCYLLAARRGYPPLAAFGAIASVGATVLVLWLIWVPESHDYDEDSVFNALIALTIVALTVAQLCLALPPVAAGRLNDPVVLITVTAAVTVGVALCVFVYTDHIEDVAWRLLGAALIVDVLGSIMLLARAATRPRVAAPSEVASPSPQTLQRLAETAAEYETTVDELVERALSALDPPPAR